MFFAGVAGAAGSEDGFRFCSLIRIGRFVDTALLEPCQRQQTGSGYDGQFYFAIAHDPFLTRPETAASLDDSLRYRRILYPLLAWVLSAGQPPLLPYVMVLINVVAATALVHIAAVAAARAGRSPWWALSLAAFGGTWMPVARDLTEPLQLALLGASVVSSSAAVGLFAGLAKETAGVVLATEAIRGFIARDGPKVVRYGLASAALAVWALFVRYAVHGPPDSSLFGQFLRPIGAPIVVLAQAFPTETARFALTALAFVMCVLTIWRLMGARDGAAWGAAAYVCVQLGAGVDNWHDPVAVFRAMAGAILLVFLSWCWARDRLGLIVLGLAVGSGALSVALLGMGQMPR